MPKGRDAARMMPRGATVFLICVAFVITTVQVCGFVISSTNLGNPKSGPFVDKLVYKVITGEDQEVLALLNNEIDLIGEIVDPQFLPQLRAAEDIQVANVQRNGYGCLTIKTDKYPYNITDFRRALAFAIDKNEISAEVWANLSAPQDSCVPSVNPFSVEGKMPYDYYDANVSLGNNLLDESGFIDANSDGWREAPNGQTLAVRLVCSGTTTAIGCCERIVAALGSLRINSSWIIDEWGDYTQRVYHHYDYDMMFFGVTFSTFDVDWLADEFWSQNAAVPGYNFPCWRNATYDSWREQLLHSTNYAAVYQAATEMQKTWIHACPEIVLYENLMLSAYRTDRFEGHVNDARFGVPGWWTNYRVHQKQSQGSPFGGTFRWSNPLDIDTFNFMVTSSLHTMNVLNELYDSLLIADRFGNDMPWLAEFYTIQTHADNEYVPEGNTMFTFNLIENASWTDGTPLTAEDVASTLTFYKETPEVPFGYDLGDMTVAYSKTAYSLVVEFATESYWHLHKIAYKPILPKHVLQQMGPDNWTTWDPRPPSETMVTSGPFNVSAHVPGEMIELSRNPNYFYRWVNRTQTTVTTVTKAADSSSILGALTVAASMSVIVVFGGLTIIDRQSKKHLSKATRTDVGLSLLQPAEEHLASKGN